MKRTLQLLSSLFLVLSLSACGISQSDYDALVEKNNELILEVESLTAEINSLSSENESLPASETSSESQSLSESPEIDETSWEYIATNHDFVTYDDVKSGKYNNQYVILPTTIDSVEYSESLNWVTCYAWFAHGDSFVCDDIIFQCDELPNYSPKSLQSGDNINVCFYINDSSFGFHIKGFEKNDNLTLLEDIYNSFKENCVPLNWEEIMRNSENVRGTTYTFTGNVFQIISEKNGRVELLLSTDNEDKYVYVSYNYKENEPKFLEDDTLTIYGTFYVPYKYTSVLGSSHSIPAIVGQFIEQENN